MYVREYGKNIEVSKNKKPSLWFGLFWLPNYFLGHLYTVILNNKEAYDKLWPKITFFANIYVQKTFSEIVFGFKLSLRNVFTHIVAVGNESLSLS